MKSLGEIRNKLWDELNAEYNRKLAEKTFELRRKCEHPKTTWYPNLHDPNNCQVIIECTICEKQIETIGEKEAYKQGYFKKVSK